MPALCVIILNYRRAALTIDCLRSLAPEMQEDATRCAVVVDNGSDDGSADQIQATIDENRWQWVRLIRSPENLGFAGGNNIGFRAVEADHYLLLNSDARVLPGSLDALLKSMSTNPQAGLVGPRIESPDGELHVSCFRYRTPMSEFLAAAGTGVLDHLFSNHIVAEGVFDEPREAQWVSFACVMIRREVIEQVGLMDEDYFMYFEDIDYSRRVHAAGWKVLHDPSAKIVHIKGGTSSVESAIAARRRVPKYYYEARSRYFAKHYGGRFGVLRANGMWLLGRSMSFAREIVGSKRAHACAHQWRDNWTNWLRPLQRPTLQKGGDL